MRWLQGLLGRWRSTAVDELLAELEKASQALDVANEVERELKRQIEVLTRQRDEARRQREAVGRAGSEHAATLAAIRALVADRRLSDVDLRDRLAAILQMEIPQ